MLHHTFSNPRRVYIREEFLFGDYTPIDQCSTTTTKKALLVGLSSYKDQPITAHLKVEDRYLYSDVPFQYIFSVPEPKALKLDIYTGDDDHIESLTFASSKLETVAVFDVEQNSFLNGSYIMTLDFPRSNGILHLIRLTTGQYNWYPSHKINFAGIQYLPSYSKNRYFEKW